MDVSGTTSESEEEPAPPKKRHKQTTPSMPLDSDCDPPQPTPEWVRSLIELRKLQNRTGGVVYAKSADKEWLEEQHRALEAGTIPVTLKCILTVASFSRRFHDCRDNFLRPEYRARYWTWSQTFIALIDYYIHHGDIKVHPKTTKYAALATFIANSQQQRAKGALPPHRDELLTALGMQWIDEKDNPSEAQSEPDESDQDADSPVDETWIMPAKDAKNGKANHASSKKRKRSQRSHREGEQQEEEEEEEELESGQYKPILTPLPQDAKSVRRWARRLIQVRGFHKKGSTYTIPDNRPELTIWMNTELAKGSMGALSPICSGILKAAKLGDSMDAIYIEADYQIWCNGYVDFIDFLFEHRRTGISYNRAPQRVIDFMFNSWSAFNDHMLSQESSSLLRAVDEGWMQSKLMEISITRNAHKRTRTKRKKPRPALEGNVVEVVLDSGTISDHEGPAPPKKKSRTSKKNSQLCQQMVTSMIKGIVAENIDGRERTEAERFAEDWVSRAGPRALNHYARNWFRTATYDIH